MILCKQNAFAQANSRTASQHEYTYKHSHTGKEEGGSRPQLAKCDKCVFVSCIHTKAHIHKHMLRGRGMRVKETDRGVAQEVEIVNEMRKKISFFTTDGILFLE